MRTAGSMCSLLLVSVFPLNAYAEAASDEPSSNMDEPGFSAAAGEDLFSSGLRLRNRSVINYGKDNQSSLVSRLEIEMTSGCHLPTLAILDTLAGLITNDQSSRSNQTAEYILEFRGGFIDGG